MLLKKLVQTTLVAAAAISMSSVAMAEVTTSIGGFVEVNYQNYTKDDGSDKATDTRINNGEYDSVESEINFNVMYNSGDKKAKLMIQTREEDSSPGVVLSGSQKVGDYTVGGVLKRSSFFTSAAASKTSSHSVARTFIGTKSWKFLMGSHLKSFDGNQVGNSYNHADWTFATDLQGDVWEYDTSMVFDYMMDGVKLTLVKSINNQNSAASNKGLLGSDLGADSKVTNYDLDNTAIKVNYKKDAITLKAMYAMGEIKGNKVGDATADGYKRKATSIQVGFQFDAGMVKPFLNYSSVSVKTTQTYASNTWSDLEKDGNGFTGMEIGADLAFGDGLNATVAYSTKKAEDKVTGSTTDKGDEYTYMGASVNKDIGAYFVGAGYGSRVTKDKAETNPAKDITETVIAIQTGYKF